MTLAYDHGFFVADVWVKKSCYAVENYSSLILQYFHRYFQMQWLQKAGGFKGGGGGVEFLNSCKLHFIIFYTLFVRPFQTFRCYCLIKVVLFRARQWLFQPPPINFILGEVWYHATLPTTGSSISV